MRNEYFNVYVDRDVKNLIHVGSLYLRNVGLSAGNFKILRQHGWFSKDNRSLCLKFNSVERPFFFIRPCSYSSILIHMLLQANSILVHDDLKNDGQISLETEIKACGGNGGSDSSGLFIFNGYTTRVKSVYPHHPKRCLETLEENFILCIPDGIFHFSIL